MTLLSVWLGAAVYFSAVVAPAAFSVLRSFELSNASEIAGSIVTRSLSVVNVGGFIVGVILLLTLFLTRSGSGRISFVIEAISVSLLTIATGVGHWVIAARMLALRAAMELPIDQVPASDARRLEFNSLHGYSVNALSLAMIAALVAIVLIARNIHPQITPITQIRKSTG